MSNDNETLKQALEELKAIREEQKAANDRLAKDTGKR